MYIVAIAWLYVTVLMAATQPTFLAGIGTFLFYGLLPCSIVMYLMGAPGRRRARKAREAAEATESASQSVSTQPDQAGLPASDRRTPE